MHTVRLDLSDDTKLKNNLIETYISMWLDENTSDPHTVEQKSDNSHNYLEVDFENPSDALFFKLYHIDDKF